VKDCIADSASVRQWGLEFPTINNGKDIVDTRYAQIKKPRRAPIITSLPTKLTRVAIVWYSSNEPRLSCRLTLVELSPQTSVVLLPPEHIIVAKRVIE
jgi:hypothetical protein